MFYVPGRVLFIHVPRTGGTSISEALERAFPGWTRNGSQEWKHATASKLRASMPAADWDGLYKFAVIRDPHATIESAWRYAREQAALGYDHLRAKHPLWVATMQRAVGYRSFAAYVQAEWLGRWSGLKPGGFRKTWCMGPHGEDVGVQVFRHERLGEAWASVCQALGIPAVELPHANGATQEAIEWPEALRLAVRQRCWCDY